MRRVSMLLCGMLLGACAAATSEVDDGPQVPQLLAPPLVSVPSFGSNPGALRMFYYAPAGLAAGAPLVVALHGCTQSAAVYSAQTEWGVLADRYRFAALFPEQPSANNSQSCFNWFLPEDVSRGRGEALSIKQMIDELRARVGSDPARIYVTGMSAGGFMTEALLAAYPDVFAGGAVNAGGPFGCASSVSEAFSCMQGNVRKTPAQWGGAVRAAFPGYAGPYPRLVAFHGATDATVAPAALSATVDQWSNVWGIDNVADVSETFRTAARKVYRDGAGRELLETYLLANTGHALSVDPGGGVDQGGATGAFSEDRDIYSSYYAAKFWGLVGAPPRDRTPPQVALLAPAEGATVSGTVVASIDASDDVAMARVELFVDGALVGGDSAAPYAVPWATTGLGDGAYALVARAIDAAGNAAQTAPRTVVVSNPGGAVQRETFSSPTGPDQATFALGGFSLDAGKDATGTSGSRSITATAAPSLGSATRVATWSSLALGAAPRLSYVRQLALSNANTTASSALRVIVDDGVEHVVDEVRLDGLRSYREDRWTARADLDLSAYAGKTVTLRLVVTATDRSSTVTRATAWLDQLEVR